MSSMEGESKSRRPVMQPYVPVHRRNQQQSVPSISSTRHSASSIKDENDVKRRGRGQFRAPSNDNFTSLSATEEQVRWT